ncbi:hypothetical protein ACVGWI_00615, partial [Enterobacter hormaechei]
MRSGPLTPALSPYGISSSTYLSPIGRALWSAVSFTYPPTPHPSLLPAVYYTHLIAHDTKTYNSNGGLWLYILGGGGGGGGGG